MIVNTMGSMKAQKMALKVSESLRSQKKPKTLGEYALESGYSLTTSKRPRAITSTKTYKTSLALENRPIIEGIQEQINKFKAELAKRDLSTEEVRILVGSIDILTKNYQLLSGGATERQVFVLPSEVIESNDITPDNGSS